MLTGMLLHVVETPGPVDLAADRTGLDAIRAGIGSQPVYDGTVGFAQLDFFHGCTGQGAQIKGLAAGRGVEARTIQGQADAAVVQQSFDNPGLEVDPVGVVIVEKFSHLGGQSS
jgi:hypothetical protein